MLRVHNPRLLDYLQLRLHGGRRRSADGVLAAGRHVSLSRRSPSGLYPAAHVAHDDSSGYASVWVRDNAHVAHAHLIDGQPEAAARVVSGWRSSSRRRRARIAAVLAGSADHDDPMNRPHIRFDGHRLAEIDERWAHAQNDALGYFLWIASRLVADEARAARRDDWREALAGTALFLEKIEFWRDEDSGHWEETRKRSASSIGTAMAGLVGAARRFTTRSPLRGDLQFAGTALARAPTAPLDRRKVAASIAWSTCRTSASMPIRHKRREADAALLFLVYPLEIVDDATADKIIGVVVARSVGDIGIRRYRGDSYWCADYKTKMLAAEAARPTSATT